MKDEEWSLQEGVHGRTRRDGDGDHLQVLHGQPGPSLLPTVASLGTRLPPKPLALHRAAGRLSPALPPFPHVGTVPTAALCLRPVAVMCQALVPLTHGNTTRGHAPKQQYARGSHVAWDWDLLVFKLKETHDSERMAPGRPRLQDHANAH